MKREWYTVEKTNGGEKSQYPSFCLVQNDGKEQVIRLKAEKKRLLFLHLWEVNKDH